MTVDQINELLDGQQEFHAASDPTLANKIAAIATGEEERKAALINDPPDGTVTLPGGYVTENGVLRDASVREMTGEDEEELARPSVARDFHRFIDSILTRCVVDVGGLTAHPKMLDELLIGDRDMLVQAIRVATYGDKMRLSVTCENCKHEHEVDYTFSADVPVRELDGYKVEIDGMDEVILDAGRHVYQIPLKRGRIADVRLVNGAIQRAVYRPENVNRSIPELNTMLLKQCIQAVDGVPMTTAEVRQLPSVDRARILKFLTEAQPGPLWEEVKHSCPRCEREYPLVIDVPTMFRIV